MCVDVGLQAGKAVKVKAMTLLNHLPELEKFFSQIICNIYTLIVVS